MNGCCYIVGAGSLAKTDLPFLKTNEDLLIAADGGYRYCVEAGMTPDLLVGDFDSMAKPEAACEVIDLPVEKDDTDIAYCVKEGFGRGYKTFVIYGGLGGDRISHTVANLQLLNYIADNGGEGTLVAGGTRIALVCAGESVTFAQTVMGSCSVFSATPTATVTLNGFYYNVKETEFSSGFPLGVSNHFVGQPANVTVHKGRVLLVVEENI